eukprot:gnl/TRDRNA2_/TRDRNA2_172698_c0_seq2.p1 gnl/TRDRNA2_/TRDRNA2_172698_c0~~gnl/TRDRNA2_/TRDRNA2_172698_c0_seq2.p1  ORF type:complete len:188 (+),score=13.01 gnl/TRDRNA2_/TRDRNA2_172698_c0_seq2:139-702(+)
MLFTAALLTHLEVKPVPKSYLGCTHFSLVARVLKGGNLHHIGLEHTTLGKSCLPQRRAARVRSAAKSLGSSPGTLRFNIKEEQECAICWSRIRRGQAVRLRCNHGWYCTRLCGALALLSEINQATQGPCTRCMGKHCEARLQIGGACVPCPECDLMLSESELRKMVPTTLVVELILRGFMQKIPQDG